MIQCLVTGILLGGLYAIIGLGMSLVFGIMRLTNLAHGDLMILGTYLTMTLCNVLGLPLILGVVITILVMMVLGYLIQNFLVNRVLDQGAEPALLIMFGVSILLSNVLLKIYGADNQTINNSLASKNVLSTDVLSVSAMYLCNFIIALLIIVGIHFLMQKTNFGRSIRATSDDITASELMGVNTKKAYAMAMIIAMAIATISGALVGSTFIFYPASGTQYLILAFGVVVIGGMGSLIGTLAGGIVLGVAQLLGGYFFGSGFQMLIAYVVLLIILAIKPDGLFVKAARK